jgi:hypothetical protein
MTCTTGRFSLSSLSVFSLGVAAVCMLGCADATPNSDTSSKSGAITGQNIIIRYLDDRVSTFFDVGISAVDQSDDGLSTGTAAVPVPMVPGDSGADTMFWTEDGLSQIEYPGGTSFIGIFDESSAPHQFTTMRVSVLATINGDCHFDYEDIDLSQSVQLAFNGEGASWDGSCWVGDLLHHF